MTDVVNNQNTQPGAQGLVITPKKIGATIAILAAVAIGYLVFSNYYVVEKKQPPIDAHSARIGAVYGWNQALAAVQLRKADGSPDSVLQADAINKWNAFIDSLAIAAGEPVPNKPQKVAK